MEVKTSTRTVRAADNRPIPARVTITSDETGHTVEIVAEYRADSGRYEAERVTVRRGTADDEVTGESLRLVAVAGIMRQGIVRALFEDRPYLAPVPAEVDVSKTGPTDETLSMVAELYSLALLLGDGPTQRVAEALRIPRSTAGRWVTRARDRGLLTVTDPRGLRKA